MNTEQGVKPTAEELRKIDVTAEITCLLNGVCIGAASVLVLNVKDTKDQELEDATVKYLTSYISGLVEQGLSRDALGFLWSQMGIAAQANIHNNVQAVAHYLLGCVLENSTVEKQS